jgi:hypothetical protein
MLLVMITTTALINYTIVSKVTSHAKDEGKKEAKE